MATINTIDPRKSKRTGNVPFVIDGTGFLTSDLSEDFSGPVFYTDASVNGGVVTDTDKLNLFVGTPSGSVAGINTAHTFPRSFDVSISAEYDVTTFPSVDGVKTIALQSFDDLNSLTYFEVYLGYKDSVGYFIRSEAFLLGAVVYSKTVAINPQSVQGLRLIRSESRFTSYIEINNQYTEMGSYLGLPVIDHKIKIYAGNSPIPVSGSYTVDILEYKVRYAISLFNKPATFTSATDTIIEGQTQPNTVGTGDVVVGFPDGTFSELLGGFEYKENQGINRDSKNFDVIISIFNFHIKPSRNELFTSAGSFIWDENYWIAPDKQNKNLFIPSLWDPVTANVPSDFIQSGHGDHNNIELIDIKKFRAESLESWHARINHGTYFIRNVPYYIHSSESITSQLTTNQTEDGRSKQNLKYLPKPGIPISASTLTLDIESGLIIDKKRFNKRGKFTGIVQNGIELNTDAVSNIDKTKNEFIVKYNSNNMMTNWRVPFAGSFAGIYSFMLPEAPLKDFTVIFNRIDIFSSEKQNANFYGNTGTVYNQFNYGEPLIDVGDYSIDYFNGEVKVILDQEYKDLGYVTFTYAYPAVIEFNNNYLFDRGVEITTPTPSNLIDLDYLGESSGSNSQIFRLGEFPILDFSDSQFLDRDNFNLFLYDESDNTFDAEWLRVRNVKEYGPLDAVYQLNSDQGIILFGDGISGRIPIKYKKVYAGYRASVRIEYEPVSSINYWIGQDTDLNLSRNNLSSGFLYLSRKALLPDSISIRFSTDLINVLEYTELSAVVVDRDGDPVPAVSLRFEIVNGEGVLEEDVVITNSNGEAKTTFVPSGLITSMGVFAQLYESGNTPETLGDPRGGVYLSSGTLLNSLLVTDEPVRDNPEDIYLFKVYDNGDPFLVYNNEDRIGGMYQVFYEFDTGSGQNELIKPIAVSGDVLIFDRSLPQPFSPSDPFYEPNLRAFVIIGKKDVQAKASVSTEISIIDSDIASLQVEYSPIQDGEWILPILPAEFTGSEINRATYITINP